MKKQLFILFIVVLLFAFGVWKLPEIVTDIGYNRGYAEGYSKGFEQGYAKCEDDMEYLFSKRLEESSSVEEQAGGLESSEVSGKLPETGSLDGESDAGSEKSAEEDESGDDSSIEDDVTELFPEEAARELLEDGTDLIGDVLKELPGKKYEYTERILREELLPRLFDIAEEYGDLGYEKGREALEGLQE